MRQFHLFLLSLFVLPASLAGCSLFEEPVEQPLSREQVNFTGEFKTLGTIEVEDDITHLFEDENGNVYYTFSNHFDLNSEGLMNTETKAAGYLLTYESKDQPVFKVVQIEELVDLEEDAVVTQRPYQDQDLGFSMEYPDNWSITTLRDAVTLEAPLAADAGEEAAPDTIVFATTEASLESETDASNDEIEAEITAFVSANRVEFDPVSARPAFLGPDRVFAVKYEGEDQNQAYFIPRSGSLFEVSFYHEGETATDTLQNVNTFSSIMSTFRFLPKDGEPSEDEEASAESADDTESADPGAAEDAQNGDTVDEDSQAETTRPEVPQVNVSTFRSFESSPFQIKMSYPGEWYYAGTSTSFEFGMDPIEQGDEGIISLILNSDLSEGASYDDNNVYLSREVADKIYTLRGPLSYENVLSTMINSLLPFAGEEE